MGNLNKKRELIKKFLKIMFLILVILIAILIYFNSDLYKNKNQKGNLGVYKTDDYEDSSLSNVKFTNIEILKNFEGHMPVSSGISELKEIFTKNLPEVIEETKDLDEKELKEYYATNSGVLTNKLKIDTEESFFNMVNKYKKITDNLKSGLMTCEISKVGTIKLLLTYSNSQQIECQMTGVYITNFNLVF